MSNSGYTGLIDWEWQSNGDLLLASGDLGTTDPTTLESLADMVRTRIKADLRGWQLYTIGADLNARLGDTVNAELNTTLCRQITNSLTNQFLARGSFTVQGVVDNGMISLFVYINQSLIATATVNPQSGVETIS